MCGNMAAFRSEVNVDAVLTYDQKLRFERGDVFIVPKRGEDGTVVIYAYDLHENVAAKENQEGCQ
jgi:hypothetical protein